LILEARIAGRHDALLGTRLLFIHPGPAQGRVEPVKIEGRIWVTQG
jgi:hypothetical protein